MYQGQGRGGVYYVDYRHVDYDELRDNVYFNNSNNNNNNININSTNNNNTNNINNTNNTSNHNNNNNTNNNGVHFSRMVQNVNTNNNDNGYLPNHNQDYYTSTSPITKTHPQKQRPHQKGNKATSPNVQPPQHTQYQLRTQGQTSK
jgi:hypothetical protein